MTVAGTRLIAAMEELHAIARGEAEPYRIYEPQAEVSPPSVQSLGVTSFAGTEGDEGQHPIQPETATKSTGVSQERAQTATGVGTSGNNLGSGSRLSATAKTEVPSDQSQASGNGQSQHNSGVRVAPVDTNSNPACLTCSQADEGSSNPRLTRAAPLHTSPEGPFHSISDWEDEDQ